MQPPSNNPLSSCRGTLTHYAEAGLLWPLTGFLPPPEMLLCLHPLSQQSQWCSLRSTEGVWVWEGWKNPLALSVQLLSGGGVDPAAARSLLALGPRNRGWGSGHPHLDQMGLLALSTQWDKFVAPEALVVNNSQEGGLVLCWFLPSPRAG